MFIVHSNRKKYVFATIDGEDDYLSVVIVIVLVKTGKNSREETILLISIEKI